MAPEGALKVCVEPRHRLDGPLMSHAGGAITAEACSERSWLPADPSTAISRVWYGEPLMAAAELPTPQSRPLAMCPPHASTTVEAFAVSVMRNRVEELAAVSDPCER